MNDTIKLLKNISIFGISQFASKVLVFLLLPFYTSCLSTSEYGRADLVFTTISLLLPIFTLEVSGAVMRFSIENVENASTYFHNALKLIAIGFCLLLFCYPLLRISGIFNGEEYLFYFLYISNAIYNLLNYYCRGISKINLVGTIGAISTGIIVGLNIWFLAILHMGVKGYILAYSLGYLLSSALIIIVIRHQLEYKKWDNQCIRNMLKYSVPLVPNNIAWWGVSSVNKYMIRFFLTSEILGLYSAALKIPSIITTMQGIITEGLVLSILEQYNEKEKDDNYYSNLYKAYSIFAIFTTIFTIILSRILSYVLFAKNFYDASKYVPLLCISPIWGALSGYLGTFYSASKKNSGMFLSTTLGAATSVILSLSLINILSIWGILISNIVTYFVIWIYRWIDVKKYIVLRPELFSDVISWILIIILAIANTICNTILLLILIDILLLCVLLFVNRKVIIWLFNIVKLGTIYIRQSKWKN